MKIILTENQLSNLLIEKVYDIDDDVNLIYNIYFKKDIEDIKESGFVTPDMFKKERLTTNQLRSDLCRKANILNNCMILINAPEISAPANYYSPKRNTISISINQSALDFVVVGFKCDLNKAAAYDNSGNIKNEFSESTIKGHISHELTHWLDQTFNKNSVERTLEKRNQTKDTSNINKHYIEINSQIANIVQAKKLYIETWDDMTFADLVKIVIPLHTITKQLQPTERAEWLKNLKKRMFREGLLGKNMR